MQQVCKILWLLLFLLVIREEGAQPALFPISFCVVPCIFWCKCVLNYCHRVSTQLQLTNISYRSWCEDKVTLHFLRDLLTSGLCISEYRVSHSLSLHASSTSVFFANFKFSRLDAIQNHVWYPFGQIIKKMCSHIGLDQEYKRLSGQTKGLLNYCCLYLELLKFLLCKNITTWAAK